VITITYSVFVSLIIEWVLTTYYLFIWFLLSVCVMCVPWLIGDVPGHR